MKKKYTVMIFDESRLDEVKTRKISSRLIRFVMLSLAFYVFVSGAGFYFLNNLYKERTVLSQYKDENLQLKDKIAGYESQLISINEKLAGVTELENKVRGLAAYGQSDTEGRQLAVGGKEVDVLQDLSKVSERKDKRFFEELNVTLTNLSMEIEKRSVSLSELADFLEEQKLMLSSTPTIWPVKGWISSGFGYRISPFTGRRVFHEGLDIATKYNTPVRSAAKGIVVFSGRKAGYGKMVIVDHGYGYITKYGHNNKLLVKAGDKVSKGDFIAEVGSTGRSTGPHVHYEVLVNGIPVNPLKFIVGYN
ncbi:Peptidase M23 [Denitrovibrio acetiphilus DSM 12809]|uniref:Peptidase M23 n=1 Tax=Denitrovibrio acetiphilus (strain DSM 12809 / NBRC 114555 / N2460) TaxID=522772 RepID=D4H2S9_DENA2|nr:M23 family metallopeptidase [Denitrovibrio acetiphilus]ADD67140.1 Peptidase M23 [Denitrovibrio acetiphilus DSM 12809]